MLLGRPLYFHWMSAEVHVVIWRTLLKANVGVDARALADVDTSKRLGELVLLEDAGSSRSRLSEEGVAGDSGAPRCPFLCGNGVPATLNMSIECSREDTYPSDEWPSLDLESSPPRTIRPKLNTPPGLTRQPYEGTCVHGDCRARRTEGRRWPKLGEQEIYRSHSPIPTI